MNPTIADFARDAARDRKFIDMHFDDARGELWDIADAYQRRALAAEKELKRLRLEVKCLDPGLGTAAWGSGKP